MSAGAFHPFTFALLLHPKIDRGEAGVKPPTRRKLL